MTASTGHALLDANIVIEVLMNRKKANACLEIIENYPKNHTISSLTIHIIWYFAEKYKLPKNQVEKLLGVWANTLSLNDLVIQLAQKRYDGNDFEDCLQAASAEIGGCDEIITLDKNFQTRSKTKLKVTVL